MNLDATVRSGTVKRSIHDGLWPHEEKNLFLKSREKTKCCFSIIQSHFC